MPGAAGGAAGPPKFWFDVYRPPPRPASATRPPHLRRVQRQQAQPLVRHPGHRQLVTANAAGVAQVEEEEKFTHCGEDVKRRKVFLQVRQLGDPGQRLENVVFEVHLGDVPVPVTVKQAPQAGVQVQHLHTGSEVAQDGRDGEGKRGRGGTRGGRPQQTGQPQKRAGGEVHPHPGGQFTAGGAVAVICHRRVGGVAGGGWGRRGGDGRGAVPGQQRRQQRGHHNGGGGVHRL